MKKQFENKRGTHEYLSQLLHTAAKPETAEWFTNYLKGAIVYRGVKTPALKGILSEFLSVTELDKEPDSTQLEHIRYWLSKPMAEDKLIAILWLQKLGKSRRTFDEKVAVIQQSLDLLEDAFASADIHDWSTNDWLCVRVLETIPLKYPSLVDRLTGWRDAPSVWQRRSGLLAFKKSIKAGQLQGTVEGIISALLPSEERFIQTAIGWVLSDASRKHPAWASRMFELHFKHLSHEVIVRHTKYLSNHAELKKKSRDRGRKD